MHAIFKIFQKCIKIIRNSNLYSNVVLVSKWKPGKFITVIDKGTQQTFSLECESLVFISNIVYVQWALQSCRTSKFLMLWVSQLNWAFLGSLRSIIMRISTWFFGNYKMRGFSYNSWTFVTSIRLLGQPNCIPQVVKFRSSVFRI